MDKGNDRFAHLITYQWQNEIQGYMIDFKVHKLTPQDQLTRKVQVQP